MIEELIYTSAAQGLKSGSKGFCTVASTAGMAANLVSLLESLSGYRHLADPGSPRGERNPVVYNHLKIRLGGRSLQILSRVAEAGLDYSGRSNKIAHHVVLSSVKLPFSGPATVQRQAVFHEAAWSDEPHLIECPRTLPSAESNPAVCRYWQEVAGDAGWGGAFAERLLHGKENEQWIIYPLGVEPLRLLEESFALLPPDMRWQITYSTFYTKLPPGIDCRVRWVVDGTPEADQLRRRYQLKALDLCQPIPAPREGDLTTAARTGTMPEARQPGARTDAVLKEPAIVLTDDDPYEVVLDNVVETAPPPLPGRQARSSSSEEQLANNTTEHKSAWALAGALVALLFLAAGTLAFYGFKHEWFSSVVASKHEQQSETPSQKPHAKSNTNEPEEKPAESEEPTENREASKPKDGGPPEPSDEDRSSGESPQGNPADLPQEKNSEDEPGNRISPPPGSSDSPQENETAKPESPFPDESVVLDKVITGAKSSIPLLLEGDQPLDVQFFYPKSNDKEDLPYHLTGNRGDWTLLPSDPNKPKKPQPYKGQELMTVTFGDDKLLFKAHKRTLDSKRRQQLVEHSIMNLVIPSEDPAEPFSCDVRFSTTQRKGALYIEKPSEDSTKFLRQLDTWKKKWAIKDLSSSSVYFLKLNDEKTVPINFSRQQDGSQGFNHKFLVPENGFFDVYLLTTISLRELNSGSLINVTLTWVPEPSSRLSINAREPKLILEKVVTLFETTLKWKEFKKKYATDELSKLTWQEWKKELDKPEEKNPPFGITKEKIADMRESFRKIGNMMEIPDEFDPETELQFLKNVHADLELGIKLESYPATTEKQLILITTKMSDSPSKGQK